MKLSVSLSIFLVWDSGWWYLAFCLSDIISVTVYSPANISSSLNSIVPFQSVVLVASKIVAAPAKSILLNDTVTFPSTSTLCFSVLTSFSVEFFKSILTGIAILISCNASPAFGFKMLVKVIIYCPVLWFLASLFSLASSSLFTSNAVGFSYLFLFAKSLLISALALTLSSSFASVNSFEFLCFPTIWNLKPSRSPPSSVVFIICNLKFEGLLFSHWISVTEFFLISITCGFVKLW